MSALERQLSSVTLDTALAYRIVDPETDPEWYIRPCLLLAIAEVLPDREYEGCVDARPDVHC